MHENKHLLEVPFLNNHIIRVKNTHRFTIEAFTFHLLNDDQVGSIQLKNLETHQSDEFPIWMDKSTAGFFVLIPIGTAGNEVMEKIDFNIFQRVIPVHFYNSVQWVTSMAY